VAGAHYTLPGGSSYTSQLLRLLLAPGEQSPLDATLHHKS
jgi:hypothetical protein